MDFALSQFHSGRLKIESRVNPDGRKMKIDWSYQDEGWPQEPPLPKKKLSPALKPSRLYLAYRWDAQIDENLMREADRLCIPHGEMVVRLLQYALDEHKSGKLKLRETAMVVKQKVNDTWQS